ncbi:MAG TPA: hypothetical protein GX710_08060, partial [Clostridiales bacterium]|nr:hypothetical protein [Clostridiales bacterium]
GWTSAINLRAGDVLVLSNGEYVVVEAIQHEINLEILKKKKPQHHIAYVG